MSVPQSRPVNKSQSSLGAFARFLLAGLLWLVVGVLAGRYFFPEIKIEQVEKQVEVVKRITVPVDRVVERVVVKEVEKVVEVPAEKLVEKVVVREVLVPVPTLREQTLANVPKSDLAWGALKVGMTKAEVTELLGDPKQQITNEESIFWYYSGAKESDAFIRFKSGGIFGFDRVEYWAVPKPKAQPGPVKSVDLLDSAQKAKLAGNLALALALAQSAIELDPADQSARKTFAELRAEFLAAPLGR